MGNLRDQLKKAKLLDQKRARQLAHEERVHRKQVGREGLEQESAERREEIARLRAEEREQNRRTQAELEQQRAASAERAACTEILERDVRRPRGRGQRFHFQVDGGYLPSFELDEQERFQLTSGEFVIVRDGSDGSHCYGLLPSESAERVRRVFPDIVVWSPGGNRR